jgi:hypothetical protein
MCYKVSTMGRGLRRVCMAVVATLLVAVVGACESPTLPLPPPAIPSISTQGAPQGEVHLISKQGAEPNALVVVYNRNPAVPLDKRVGGAQADGQGTWDAFVVASPGDVLDLTQQFGNEMSPPTSVQVPP